MTCNDCGREISDCDRNGCREVRGTAWNDMQDLSIDNPMPRNYLHETLRYPCGCEASGVYPLPTYCPEHGSPAQRRNCQMSRLDEAMARANDWQRMVLQEWSRRNPEPQRIKMGRRFGFVDIVPTLCICSVCRSRALIIPNDQPPSRGFVLCPRCSAHLKG